MNSSFQTTSSPVNLFLKPSLPPSFTKLESIGNSKRQIFQKQLPKYSELNLNQDKATKPQTVQIVRQGEATPYWFKVNPLYNRNLCKKSLFPSNRKPVFGFRLSGKEEFCKDRSLLQLNSKLSILTLYFAFHVFYRFHFKPTAQFTYCNQIFFFRLFKSN